MSRATHTPDPQPLGPDAARVLRAIERFAENFRADVSLPGVAVRWADLARLKDDGHIARVVVDRLRSTAFCGDLTPGGEPARIGWCDPRLSHLSLSPQPTYED